MEVLHASEPQPYLPKHPEFGESVGVRYFAWRVAAHEN